MRIIFLYNDHKLKLFRTSIKLTLFQNITFGKMFWLPRALSSRLIINSGQKHKKRHTHKHIMYSECRIKIY